MPYLLPGLYYYFSINTYNSFPGYSELSHMLLLWMGNHKTEVLTVFTHVSLTPQASHTYTHFRYAFLLLVHVEWTQSSVHSWLPPPWTHCGHCDPVNNQQHSLSDKGSSFWPEGDGGGKLCPLEWIHLDTRFHSCCFLCASGKLAWWWH